MVQNDTLQDIQLANEDRISEAVATKAAQDDLHATQGQGVVLSTARHENGSPAQRQVLLCLEGHCTTRNPWGSGFITSMPKPETSFTGNEIHIGEDAERTGYKSNVKWHSEVVSIPLSEVHVFRDEGNTVEIWVGTPCRRLRLLGN